MPWNKRSLLQQIRQAYRKGLPRSEIRRLEQLARSYGATRKEIDQAKAAAKRR